MVTRLEEIANGVAPTHGATAKVEFGDIFVPLQNDPAATGIAVKAAQATIGADNVQEEVASFAGSEDVADLIKDVPGT